MSDDGFLAAVGFALTGDPAVLTGRPDDAELPAWLATCGWDDAAVVAHAERVLRDGGVWPHEVPEDRRRSVGSARLFGAVRAQQARLGLLGAPLPRRAERPLTPDERRLLADVPPHHGH